MTAETLPDRFWSKVEKTDGCWVWTGARQGRGYGNFLLKGKNRLAHVVSFEAHKGPVPAGLVVDHTCNVRNCVNPAHLRAVTQRINSTANNGFAAENSRKTHCSKGHELSGANLRIVLRKDGVRRKCRKCNVHEKRVARAKRRIASHV